MDTTWMLITVFSVFLLIIKGQCVFVDNGVPYNDGPLMTGELTVTVTTDGSPKHVKVYFPLQKGDYGVVYFLGGFSTIVPAEFYSIVLSKVASHGFFVFGVDYRWPLDRTLKNERENYGQDINMYFKELEYLQNFMKNRTLGTPDWNDIGLMCHSAGCDITLKMIETNRMPFKSSVFLEPYSQLVRKPLNYTIPALMYGTQLSFEAMPCNVHGYGFQQYYKEWTCPRIALEVADFGHCDLLDPVGWEVCHVSHFCKTTNDTRLDQYRQFVQGVTTSFFMTTLQGRKDATDYITNQSKLPLKCLVDVSDLNC